MSKQLSLREAREYAESQPLGQEFFDNIEAFLSAVAERAEADWTHMQEVERQAEAEGWDEDGWDGEDNG